MKTVEEILRESGLTDEQIKALDAKITEGLTKVVSTASQTLEEAERVKRATAETFEKEINPALDKWANDSATLTAERDYYKTLAEKAKEGGFVPGAAPFTPPASAVPGTPPRNDAGRFVANAGPVPGSPQYMTREEGFRAVTAAQWFVSEYMRLHNGAPPPDDMEALASQAQAERIPFRDFVAKKYDFAGKREAIKAAEQKKLIDAEVAKAVEKTNKEWAEKMGNNPDIRAARTSQYATIEKDVKAGQRPDPLKLTQEQRRQATRQQIQKEIAANETVQ